jgi:hypothetical protein
MTYRPTSLRDRIRKLLDEHGDLSPREIAKRLGCDPESARFTKHDVKRHAGKSLPAPEVFKRRREVAKKRATPVLELQAAGKSFEVQVGPDQGHSNVNQQRMMEFFIEHLVVAPAGPKAH